MEYKFTELHPFKIGKPGWLDYSKYVHDSIKDPLILPLEHYSFLTATIAGNYELYSAPPIVTLRTGGMFYGNEMLTQTWKLKEGVYYVSTSEKTPRGIEPLAMLIVDKASISWYNEILSNTCSELINLMVTAMEERAKHRLSSAKYKMDNLFSEIKNDILTDLGKFMNNRERYAELGIPWKRGYIFHGPPGNGKTLMIKTLASHFGLETYDLSYIDMTGKPVYLDYAARSSASIGYQLLDLCSIARRDSMNYRPSIYFLEDIERVVGRQSNDDHATMTLGTFLNCIDGVRSIADGSIIIATTNHLENLAGALKGRPGRFDRLFEFKQPNLTQVKAIFNRFGISIVNPVSGQEDYFQLALADTYSMAFVQEFIVQCIMAADSKEVPFETANIIFKQLEEHRVLTSTTQLLTRDDNDNFLESYKKIKA